MCCAPPSYDSRPRSFRLGSVSTSLASAPRLRPAGIPLRVPTATSMTTSAMTPASLAAAERSRAFCSWSTAWMNSGDRLPQLHRAANLAGDRLLVVMQMRSMPCGEQRLGLAQLGGADADRASRHLQLGDGGALVRLGMRSGRDAVSRDRRLHLRDVRFHSIEIDAERRRVEIPLGHADVGQAAGEATDDLVGRVAFHRARHPDMGREGRRHGEEDTTRGRRSCPRCATL